MTSLGLHLLTVVLGVAFIFLGHIKLTPQFFPEYHSHMRNEFGKLNKEFPLYQQTSWRPYAKNYRIAIGVTETVAGTLLLLGGVFTQTFSNFILLVIMTNFLMAFQKLHYGPEYMGGAILLTLLLAVRLFFVRRSPGKVAVKQVKKTVEEKVE